MSILHGLLLCFGVVMMHPRLIYNDDTLSESIGIIFISKQCNSFLQMDVLRPLMSGVSIQGTHLGETFL